MNASVTTRLSELGSPARDAQSVGSRDVAEILETELSDEALMAGVCEGTMEALASLFRRHARTVRVVSYRVLRDSCEADDMVHEVFLLVHHHCKKFDSSRGSARFWILQMAYRRAISRRRYLTYRHFYTRLDLDDTASEFADPRTSRSQVEDLIDGRLGNGGLQPVSEALSENQCQTLRLFFIGDYTLDEIAARLGQPEAISNTTTSAGWIGCEEGILSGIIVGHFPRFAEAVASSSVVEGGSPR